MPPTNLEAWGGTQGGILIVEQLKEKEAPIKYGLHLLFYTQQISFKCNLKH